MITLFKSNKPFRIYLLYQIFSALGGGVFSLFMLLSIHLLYQNPMYTGIAGFLMVAPAVFSFMVGPLVDRKNKVTIMRLTTFLEFLVLALVTFTPLVEQIGVLFMFAAIFIYSIAALFEGPAGTALLPQIIKDDELVTANSLINIAAMLGGIGIAVVLIRVLGGGEAGGMQMDTLRYIYGLSAVFLALAFIFSIFLRDPSAKKAGEAHVPHKFLPDLIEGVKFLRGNVLRFIAIAFIFKAMAAEMGAVNMPMFVETHAGARAYIILTVSGMVGGLIASTLAVTLGNRFKLGYLLAIVLVVSGIIRVVFANVLPVNFYASLLLVVSFSAVMNIFNIVSNALEQRLPPKDTVGRVSTLITTFAALFLALGALAGGVIGRMVVVIDHVFVYQGIAYTVIGVVLLLVPTVRKLPPMVGLEKKEDNENGEPG